MMISLKCCAFLVLLVWVESGGALESRDCRCKLGSNRRIVGGQVAPQNYIPWHIALHEKGSFICGGFILNEWFVATAAHCTDTKPDSIYKVALGQSSLKNVKSNDFYQAEKIYKHPSYNERRLENGHDLALIKLKTKIKFVPGKVEPACLNFNTSKFSEIMTSGYGSTTKIVYRNNKPIRQGTYNGQLKYIYMEEFTNRHSRRVIYARGKKRNEDTCTGDSGSPAHVTRCGRTGVIGVTSFGDTKRIGPRLEELCGGTSGFCRLSYERSFIERYVKKGQYCQF